MRERKNVPRVPKIMIFSILVVGFFLMIQYEMLETWYQENHKKSPMVEMDELFSKIRSLSNLSTMRVNHSQLAEVVTQLVSDLGIANSMCQSNSSYTTTTMIPTTTLTTTTPSVVPKIYIITPTYRRPEQIPEIIRLSQTLMHVEKIHWLVIEDAINKTSLVTEHLKNTNLPFTHLTAPMPEKYRKKKGAKPKGVSNRNKGIKWIRKNAADGVLYFADDDNVYDLRLFEEIRWTKRVSMWPVGLCTKVGLSTPIVKNGKFVGFFDGWIGGRRFPVDMAGFAVNVKFLHQRPNAIMPFQAGYEEEGFLRSLAPLQPSEIELKSNNCSKILVWHTQTKPNKPPPPIDLVKYGETNVAKIYRDYF